MCNKEYKDRWWKPLVNKPVTSSETEKERLEQVKKKFDKTKTK